MVNVPAAILHASSAAVMAYGYNSLRGLPLDGIISTQYGGHFRFLTIQGLAIAFVTMVVSLLVDLLPAVQAIRTVKRAVMMVSLPVSIVVSSIYWTLLSLAPQLLLEKDSPGEATPSSSEMLALMRIPLDIDLSLHACPAATLLLDFLVFERKYSAGAVRVGARVAVLLSTVGYSWWAEHCAKYTDGVFPYPFLTESPFWGRVCIYAGAGSIAYFSFLGLNKLHP
ncbi:FAR-17a/AIG1-like protein [Schizophyllum amplum]|uniref:FAR-17a/AIG1-like protein n=1 Tax=Schizophyllum amplum TaxID=97359 RepID=A0A550CTS4_9AGAR|nr:FAR-17a/AIG1-like protein [Auriculariopsis ampla]